MHYKIMFWSVWLKTEFWFEEAEKGEFYVPPNPRLTKKVEGKKSVAICVIKNSGANKSEGHLHLGDQSRRRE